jgi:hypothetical protein
MSHVYNGNPAGAVLASYTFPDDGDGPPKAADYNVPGEGMADDIARLKALAVGGAITRAFGRWDYDPSDWTIDLNGSLSQVDISAGVKAPTIAIDIPDGATINTIRATIDPVAGHGAMPVGVPFLQLIHYQPSGDAATTVGTQSDIVVLPQYELRHVITLAAINHVVSRANRVYRVRVQGESQGNAIAGLRVLGIEVDFTLANIDKGAG